ncbi:hypothetical protein KFJ24_01990 [Marinobacter sediminum]|nr:hypothetical protein [Marinobacter sediminum]MCM0611242.1 hypothetical protein [Marinobacter sediminum]
MAVPRRVLDLLAKPVHVHDEARQPLKGPVKVDVHFEKVSFHYRSSGDR